MFAITLSWIIIMLTLIPLGLLVLRLLNYTSLKVEFTIIDVFLCGVGAVSAITCILSLCIPTNEKSLLVAFFLSMFCIIKYEKGWVIDIKEKLQNCPRYCLILIPIILLVFIMIPVWFNFTNYDPLFYHYSNVKWGETYSIIPGLANLEERFGFNSNYLLLCSLFSLRGIFGDLIIGLQSLFAALLACWIVYELIKTNFEIKRIFLLVLYFLFVYINRVELGTTSTDIVPNLAVIYLFSNVILYPYRIKYPTYIIIPLILVTFKLSNVFLLCLSVYPIILFIKDKNYNILKTLFFLGALILITWMVRNIIISGYLIFPYWQIDIFNVDWKVPVSIPQSEQSFIKEYARGKFMSIMSKRDSWSIHSYLFPIICSYIISFISCLASFVLLLVKRAKISKIQMYIFACLFLNYIFWLILAPDIRFGYGFVFSIIFYMFSLFFLSSYNEAKLPNLELIIIGRSWKKKTDLNRIFLFVFSLFLLYSSAKWMSQYRYFLVDNYNYNNSDAFCAMLYAPITTEQEKKRVLEKEGFEGDICMPYKLNDSVTIYVANMKRGFFFDLIPIMRNSQVTHSGFMQDYKNIEARGSSVKDGFRSKSRD